MRSLWQSIRQKVFPNYSTRGYRLLIDWINVRFRKLADFQTSKEELAKRPVNQRHLPDDLSDENLNLLVQLCDTISIISVSRQKTEDEVG
jgi:hypothetical protein